MFNYLIHWQFLLLLNQVSISYTRKDDVVSVTLECGGSRFSVYGCCSAAGTVLMGVGGIPLQNGLGLKGSMLMFQTKKCMFEGRIIDDLCFSCDIAVAYYRFSEALGRIKNVGGVLPLAQISTTDENWHLAVFKSGEPLRMVEDAARVVQFC